MPAGQELKGIREWEDLYDELDELKKIFYEFMKRWTEQTTLEMDANRPRIYEKHEDEKPFSLDEDRLMREKLQHQITEELEVDDQLMHAKTLDPTHRTS